jgi:hypothetical protein
MTRSYADLVYRGRARYGEAFSETGLDPRFVRWYESEERVRVRYIAADGSYTQATTGTIGATTGWRPAFLLMHSARSRGSSYVIGPRDTVVAVKRGRTYEPVGQATLKDHG